MSRSSQGPTVRDEDSIEDFLEEQRLHGKSERTLRAYRRVLRSFEDSTTNGTRPIGTVDREACLRWVHEIRGEHKPSTVATYASYVNRFFRYQVATGNFDDNPMTIVIDQMTESIETDPVRRDISLSEMRSFVNSISHPLTLAIVLTFLKTGMRVGELCNLDLRDLAIDSTNIDVNWTVRPELDGRTNAIFVDSSYSKGMIGNGQQRNASNKRQRSTIIPVDSELKKTLLRWLAIRPTARSPSDPLFIETVDSWGSRVTPETVRYRIKQETEPWGWHREGADASQNVTPHYFRHFFTTVMRDRLGDRGIVKYLRGDVADDIIDTYTHNWGDRVKHHYEHHIYSLL